MAAVDRNTKINLGSAGVVLATVVGAAFWLTSEFRAVRDEVHQVRLELAQDRLDVAVLQQRVKALERGTK